MIMISKDWWKFSLKATYEELSQVKKVSRTGGRWIKQGAYDLGESDK
jgi:hypothetical protein